MRFVQATFTATSVPNHRTPHDVSTRRKDSRAMIDSALPVSLGASAFTVFALGLRHGADPDHLAAIDNLTRNGVSAGRRLSKFFGTLFAGGHSIMVLSIAALAGLLGSRIAVKGELIETIGTWVSILTRSEEHTSELQS